MKREEGSSATSNVRDVTDVSPSEGGRRKGEEGRGKKEEGKNPPLPSSVSLCPSRFSPSPSAPGSLASNFPGRLWLVLGVAKSRQRFKRCIEACENATSLAV
ncbi:MULTISPECIES: hypothetical protein [unclassified Microcoleus]|uniref:hypothetical protein n=1 Tax=unclassified Microcoleus TaxID=2642155 RepID=UPI002FD79CE2